MSWQPSSVAGGVGADAKTSTVLASAAPILPPPVRATVARIPPATPKSLADQGEGRDSQSLKIS
jgi:hypothetical protein